MIFKLIFLGSHSVGQEGVFSKALNLCGESSFTFIIIVITICQAFVPCWADAQQSCTSEVYALAQGEIEAQKSELAWGHTAARGRTVV